MSERALIDTGPMVALYAEDDPHRESCTAALSKLTPPLLTCWPVVTEAAWLLRKRPDGFRKLIEGFSLGIFALLPLDNDDLTAVSAVMRRYETSGIQLADAALAHLADREGIRIVFTIDRRDFAIIRLKRNRSLRIVPEVQ